MNHFERQIYRLFDDIKEVITFKKLELFISKGRNSLEYHRLLKVEKLGFNSFKNHISYVMSYEKSERLIYSKSYDYSREMMEYIEQI